MAENSDKSAGQSSGKTSFGVDVPQTSGPAAGPPQVSRPPLPPPPASNTPGQLQKGTAVGASPASQKQYFHDPTAAIRAMQREQGGRGSDASWGAQVNAASDMLSKFVGYMTGAQDMGKLSIGTIKDGTAIANTYWVNTDHAQDPIMATALCHSSMTAMGATEINTYVPGTRVILMTQDRDRHSFIMGAIPNFLYRGKDAFQDTISQASRNRVDDCHKKHLKQTKSSEISDYSNWRPYDATLGGEWGSISCTGIRVTVDDFMLQAAVNEFCGIYGFYHDNMLRVAGYNMQVWTAGSERDAYMDQAECNDSQGYTPYPWEGVGVLIPGPPVIEEYEPGCFQCFEQKPYYSRWENKHEFAQPYHRSQVFFGYLGQGMRQLVHAPPPGKDRWTYKGVPSGPGETPYDSKIEPRRGKGTGGGFAYNCVGGPEKLKDHQEEPVYGLSEENKALDGRLFIASAKGVHISKRILLPFPQRIKRPEDPKHGDDADEKYKAASKYGKGPDHDITGTIKTTDNQYPNFQRATALLDLHGYLYNYSGLHAFYWHEKDYKTWEQQELPYAKTNQKIPKFNRLLGKMYLKEEIPVNFKIDHRYDKKGEQKFYETESFVSLLEDGGVVIGDGYGAEIRMTGGCVFISAPGDVWLKGGRDIQAWAGNDVIARANKTVDISATEKNVRIKAERNVLVLAGNETSDREGGILLESRSKTIEYDFEKCGDEIRFGGIVMRAPKSNVVTLAKDIYLRTGGGEVEKGDIVLDASKGEKEIVTKSKNIYHYVDVAGGVYHFFGENQGGFTSRSNLFRENVTLLCGPVGTEGSVFVNGDVLCNGSGGFFAANGHIFTRKAEQTPLVVPCTGECTQKVNEAVEFFTNLIVDEVPDIGDEINETKLKELWYTDKRAGNDRVMTIMEFSFRKDDDYDIPDFMLYEDRWQQMARIGGEIPERWKERPVPVKVCAETYPFPGKKWIQDKPAYKEQDFKIVQLQGGGYIDKQRNPAPGLAGEYRDPEFKPPREQIINGYYPIVPRPK